MCSGHCVGSKIYNKQDVVSFLSLGFPNRTESSAQADVAAINDRIFVTLLQTQLQMLDGI